METAWYIGYRAYLDRIGKNQNPYIFPGLIAQQEYDAWNDGWDTAQYDASNTDLG